MADFKAAFKLTSGIEGGYTVDNGGPTYKGISWNAWKREPIVQKIFSIVNASKPQKYQVINNTDLEKLVVSFYKTKYWDTLKGDLIENQTLANLIYDFYINSGSAMILINRAVGGREVTYLNETTLKILNERPAFSYEAILKARKDLYDRLAFKNPKFKKNNTYAGWISRLNKFPKSLTV
ncbi:MAG: glycosyl hydrolase 108 family protein [Ferruginibacter sp.]